MKEVAMQPFAAFAANVNTTRTLGEAITRAGTELNETVPIQDQFHRLSFRSRSTTETINNALNLCFNATQLETPGIWMFVARSSSCRHPKPEWPTTC